MLETRHNHLKVSYRGPARGPHYEQWREDICRAFCRVDVTPAEERIDCRNEFAMVDTISLAIPTGSSAVFSRTRELLADACDDIVVIHASHGRVRVTQRDTEIDIAAGQTCLTEMNVCGSAAMTATGWFTTTRIPRHLLLRAAPRAEDQLARTLVGDPTRTAMFGRYFALCSDIAADLDAVGSRAAAQHLVDLAGLMLGGDTMDAAEPRYGDARLELMKAAVLGRLGDAALTIDAIARHHGLSVRQAQRLFADAGITFTEFVLEQRLALARRLLSEAGSRHRKISDIAFSAGFGDLSYFNRVFRRRFGATPSDLQGEANPIQ